MTHPCVEVLDVKKKQFALKTTIISSDPKQRQWRLFIKLLIIETSLKLEKCVNKI